MTALRASAVYLAAVLGVFGAVVLLGATRALAARGETGVFLIGLVAGVGLWAWALFLVAAALVLVRIEARVHDMWLRGLAPSPVTFVPAGPPRPGGFESD